MLRRVKINRVFCCLTRAHLLHCTHTHRGPTIKTALEKLKDLWAAGERRKALKLAAAWPRLGVHKNAIQQGWAATSNPKFYLQLGKDPEVLYYRGLAALAAAYDLPIPTQETT